MKVKKKEGSTSERVIREVKKNNNYKVFIVDLDTLEKVNNMSIGSMLVIGNNNNSSEIGVTFNTDGNIEFSHYLNEDKTSKLELSFKTLTDLIKKLSDKKTSVS